MKLLITALVLVTCAYLGWAEDCVDSSVLCSARKETCEDNVWFKQICPKSCGSCASKKLYKLTYFALTARGEQIRWILEQGNANWEDIRIELVDWPAFKTKTLTGQLPFLEVDNVTIAQSGAIALYLAKELDLAGSNNLETAEVHMIWDTVQETFNAFASLRIRYITDVAEKAKAVEKYDTDTFPKLVKFLENRLKDGNEWLVGNKLSAADIVTASLIDMQLEKGTELVKASTSLSTLFTKVMALPKIKQWIATRPDDI